MLGRRGQFEGVVDWLIMLPLWWERCVNVAEGRNNLCAAGFQFKRSEVKRSKVKRSS